MSGPARLTLMMTKDHRNKRSENHFKRLFGADADRPETA
jgi:hypothetical protein